MAFWGTEVKPGKPVTHSSEYTSGRLRISQATLAIGEATKKSVVQCNVGKRSPVLLCVLLPNQTESCHLDLEFEESDDVVFSVIGPRSVYLTGYYVRKFQQSNLQSDTESFGVDIENSQNEGSSYRTDDDEYEDSFINDDNELQVSPQSPVASSEEMDEITSENDKPKNKKDRSKQLKKKYRVIESDSEAKSLESEDEDAYTLSAFKSKRAMKSSVSDSEEKIDQVTEKTVDEAEDDGISESNQEADPFDVNDQSERETKLSMHEGTQVKNKKNEVPKEVRSDEDNIIGNEVLTDDRVHGNNSEDIIINQNLPMTNEKDQMKSLELEKPKKKRKHSLKDDKTSEIDVNKDHSVHGEYEEHQVEPSTNIIKPEPLANGKKKAKKKMKKTQGEEDMNMSLPKMTDNQQTISLQDENQIIPEVPIQNMTLPNGLIIEELASGPPNRKVAALGKTVKIYYTGMLKDSGHVFDSNMGKTAFKFRLGDEEYIDGWKVGIDGMRVGDKRRLIIPPHLGFGDHGVEGKVPPRSWLVYDVELVSVRR